MVLAVFILAIALVPGLQAIRWPIQHLPHLIEPEFEPHPMPSLTPEVEAHPIPSAPVTNPCDSCFEYITALIDQLGDVEAEAEVIPHPMPLPEANQPELEISPHPMPQVGLRPQFKPSLWRRN